MRRTGIHRVALFASLVALSCGGAAKPAVRSTKAPVPCSKRPRRDASRSLVEHENVDATSPGTIVVKHVLVHFAGAKNARPGVTRSRGDACVRALEARAQLQGGESFADVVANYGDDRGATSRDGTVGAITREDVLPAFADAAFELQRGEVSHVVETDRGYHTILRTE